jgi:hypothetical protein
MKTQISFESIDGFDPLATDDTSEAARQKLAYRDI